MNPGSFKAQAASTTLWLVCLIAFSSRLHAAQISTPDGTTTSYVEGSGVRVLAPRAARAQKVLFDTPDRQMIYEPDTPFRQFFDVHGPDFAPGKVNYAKATILSDIVSMLRNKEFVRLMITDVVESHHNTAISWVRPVTKGVARANELIQQIHRGGKEMTASMRELGVEVLCQPGTNSAPPSIPVPQEEAGHLLRLHFFFSRAADAITDVLQALEDLGHPSRYATLESVALGLSPNDLRFDPSLLLANQASHLKEVLTNEPAQNLLHWAASEKGDLSLRNQANIILELIKNLVPQFERSPSLDAAAESQKKLLEDGMRLFLGFEDFLESVKTLASTNSITNQYSTVLQQFSEFKIKSGPAVFGTKRRAGRLFCDALEIAGNPEVRNQLQDLTTFLSQRDQFWVDKHKKLLVDALYLELARENYPDMRDEDIDLLVKNFDQEAARYSSSNIWNFTTSETQNLPPQQALSLELRQVLKSKNYFRHIIDQAVGKRLDLFRVASSPAEPVGAAVDALGGLTERHLARADFQKSLVEGRLSLWTTWLQAQTSKEEKARILRPPLNDDALPAAELQSVGAALREEFRFTQATTIETMAAAVQSFFLRTTNADRLNPLFELKGTKTDALDAAKSNLVAGALKFEPLTNAYNALTNNRAVYSDSKKAWETKLELEGFEGAITNLSAQLRGAVQTVHDGTPVNSRFPIHRLLRNLDAALRQPVTNAWAKASNSVPTLKELVIAAIPSTEDTLLPVGNARLKLAEDFRRTFTDIESLVSSDEPILKAFLGLEAVRFPEPEMRRTARLRIPTAFRNAWDAAATPSLASLKTALSNLLSKPELSYLFGLGASDNGAVNAFKAEFFEAFKHRLTEAVAAEREVDYDYWWITFYPKAIPMGAESIKGESLIEFGFPETVVPERQYQRWLQDQSRFNTLSGKGDTRPSEEPDLSQIQRDRIIEYLKDILTTLESPDLITRYSNLRPGLFRVLARFESPISPATGGSLGQLKLGLRQFCHEIDPKTFPDPTPAWDGTSRPRPHRGEDSFLSQGELEQASAARTNAWSLLTKVWHWTPGRESDLEALRPELQQVGFGMLHILVGALGIADSGMSLPEKVAVYLSAHLPLTGWFENREKLTEFAAKAKNSSPHTSPVLLQCLQQAIGIPDLADETNLDREGLLAAATARKRFRELAVNAYFSAYPEIPDRESLRQAFLQDPANFRGLVLDWIRPVATNGVKNPGFAVGRLLDRAPFLTPSARASLMSALTNSTNCQVASLSNRFDKILENTRVTDLLHEHLYDHHFKSLLATLGAMDRTDRQSIDYRRTREENFTQFRGRSRTVSQRGVQILELLPSSRDDLVSVSVSDGGVIARAAAQGQASAAYDVNKLQMVAQNAQMLFQALNRSLGSSSNSTVNSLLGLGVGAVGQEQSGARSENYKDRSNLGSLNSLGGYSLGASATANIYARAGYAMAYSRRREYLNAAITAAGRGDNFARWVVRRSDLRSKFLAGPTGRATAAAHTGYPNGDQPFFMLVKIPRDATHSDWKGRKYVHFNSAYAATKRTSWWKLAGPGSMIGKLPIAVINPNWWTAIEEGDVATVYPFKWNVHTSREQKRLFSEANPLGGAILLDDTDKVPYSHVLNQLEAEENFIRVTREAQSGDLNQAMETLKPEAAGFRSNTLRELRDDARSLREIRAETAGALGVTNHIQALETELQRLRSQLPATNGSPSETP
jgi:hypothetical protein